MRKRFAIGLVAAAIIVGLAVAKRHELLRGALVAGAGIAGYQLRIGGLHIDRDEAVIAGLSVARATQPLLRAKRITLRYSLRDLFPGSRHRFGLTDVEAVGVKLTLTRFRDGSFDIALPGAGAPPPGPQRVNPVPLHFHARVSDAQVVLREPTAFDESARSIRISGINAEASIDSAAVTSYRVAGAFEERRRHEPFTVRGRIDVPAGFATHHAKAARFPLRALSNYFAQSPDVVILRGGASNFDAVVYALGLEAGVPPAYHVSLKLDVQNARLVFKALAIPIEGINARLNVVDNAFFVTGGRATLAKIPLQIRGGIFDLNGALTGAAQLRLAVWGSGNLADLREAFSFTRDQPIAGKATLGVSVRGPINDPLIVADASAARASYRALPFDDVAAGVVYHSNVVALVPLLARYGGVSMAIRGRLQTGAHLKSEFGVHVAGPASRLPYLDEMLGDEPIVIDAAASGNDLRFHVLGSAASARGVDRVAALVQMNGNGTALVDPFWLHTSRGTLDGAYLLDRPRGTSAFWMTADRLAMHAPRYRAFPNLTLPQMPKIEGGLFGISAAGGGSGNDIALAGVVHAANTSIAGVPFARLRASLAGTLANAPINRLQADGPWGTFSGSGAFSTQRFVATGKYRGTFEGLAPFLGSAIDARGPVSGKVAIAVEAARIVVVGSDLAMPGATLRSIPIDRASMTLAVEGNRLRIYSAHAHAAGGDVVAAGTLALGPGAKVGALSLVANRLAASQLRGIGLPLEGGTISASGDLRAGSPIPSFLGGVAVNGSRVAQFSLSGDSEIDLHGDSVGLQRMIGSLGGTYARVDGSIGSLTSGSPSYSLSADVAASQIARTLHAFGLPNYMTDGSFNARLHIGGRSISPTVSGAIGVPAGEVNGLPFVDASAALTADRTGVSMRGGSVVVGTTKARFDAVSRPHVQAMHVDAPYADLSDFNNFFDTGDTLDGDGSVRLAAASRRARITTSGNIDIRSFRYRNLPIGDTRAVWSSARNSVNGSLAIGGSEGELHAHGTIDLVPGPQWLDTLERSRYDLAAGVGNFDLAFWLPALGMQALPITGRAAGEATVHGRFPQIGVSGYAGISGGTLGPLTLDTATVRLHAAGKRVVVDQAQLQTPGLSATASGTFGLDASQPLDLRVYAATNRLAELVYDSARVRIPVSGAFESTLTIGGTYRAPSFVAGFDGTGVKAYGIPISTLFGELRLRRNSLVLSNAGVTFKKGEASLTGAVPLRLAPLGITMDQPLSFDVDVVGLDPGIFADTLGANTKMTGSLDGHLGISGTLRSPAVVGRLSLSNGSYVSDLERIPITQMVADIVFDHASASLTRASARAGSGILSGSGKVSFPSGLSASGTTVALKAVARGAQLDLPAYGSGTLDAVLTVAKQPAALALLSGSITLSNAALPFASFLKAATQTGSGQALALPLAFDVRATAGKNVRVRGSGYGAGLDIGASGSVRLAGTLATPTLEGTFASTGGTLTYFDRAFRVQQASVRFNATDGVLPALHAVASTTVVNPDPDRARNPYGSADVTITVNGPIAGLKVGLDSSPTGYTRDQILALIAPLGGFVSGISFSRQQLLARQQPAGITPLGTLSPIPNVTLSQNSTITVGQEAFNILNAQFTAGLLAPVETTIGQGLGLSSINLTLGYYGNVGLTATRLLGKAVSAVYAVTFGLPQIQSFGLVLQPGPSTSANLNFFYESGPTKLLQLPGSPVGYSAGYLVGQPLLGNSGFSLTLQHYFW
ncbi:MAG TPA: translocation/assembly module TamB domain-containing protein [Candidatus Cybelea sp.]